jgi:hypothetical protein
MRAATTGYPVWESDNKTERAWTRGCRPFCRGGQAHCHCCPFAGYPLTQPQRGVMTPPRLRA